MKRKRNEKKKSKFAIPHLNFISGEGTIILLQVKALITIEGNKMTHTQIERNGRTSKHIREFFNDKLIVVGIP